METQTFHIKTRDEFSPEEMKRFENIFLKLSMPSRNFSSLGLRYPIADLNSLGKKNIFFPIEVMATFVDAVTKERCDSGERMPDLPIRELHRNYKVLNATTVGNLAYVALNSIHQTSKGHCYLLLEEIYKAEIQKIV